MFGLAVEFFYRHLQQQFGLLYLAPAIFPALDDILELAELLLDSLGLLAVTPEVRSQGLALQSLDLLFLGG